MIGSIIAVLILLILLGAIAHRRKGAPHRDALQTGWKQLGPLLPRLAVALAAASFLSVLIPEKTVIALIGEASGLKGILIASLLGGFLPGGPMVSFPLVVAFIDAQAGTAQIIALITSWSVLAFHRVAAYELPLLGTRHTIIRLIASAPLPVAAGSLAGILTALAVGL